MKCLKYLGILISFWYTNLMSQPYTNDIPVYHGNLELHFPWIGGLDNPRFQNIDLNQDGFQDLVVFDAVDHKLLTFLYTTNVLSTEFIFAPEYIAYFPDNLFRWILLVDYNQDNEPDLFTCNQNSDNILVYKNIRKQTGQLGFELIYNPLQAEISPGTFAPLSVMDIPSITDVDNDGDIDILAVSPSGFTVELYRNVSNEPEILDLRIRSFCWGRFTDNADSILKVNLHQPCNFDQKTQHVGGTILALSLNGDSLIDALLSDQGPNNVVALYNGGTNALAYMVYQDTFFPSYDVTVDLQYYPAMFHVDVNGDNQKDLIFSPNGYNMPSNELYFLNHSDAGWLYLNHSTTQSPHFKLLQKNFFYEQALDGGSYSSPVLFDEDLDGDLDLLLFVNQHTILQDNRYQSKKQWNLYENIGTTLQPVFSLKTNNYQGWNDLPLLDTLKNVHPAVADIDKDGDTDFFIGHRDGRIIFLENQFNGSAQYVFQSSNYANIQVQANSAPHFADIDGDNDLDLLIGVSNGTITYCENIGGPHFAQWSSALSNWSNINVTDEQNPIVGNAKPFWFDYDKNGTSNLLIGNSSGFIKVYEYQKNQTFVYLGELFGVRLTTQAVPFVAQLTQDSLYFFVGNAKGGVYLFKEQKGYVERQKINTQFGRVYPNPFTDYFEVQMSPKSDIYYWNLWNVYGEKVDEGFFYDHLKYEKPLSEGMYILVVHNKKDFWTLKIWKTH